MISKDSNQKYFDIEFSSFLFSKELAFKIYSSFEIYNL